MKILDLGCGPAGSNLATVWGVPDSDEVTGVDLDERDLAVARQRFPKNTYLTGCGEAVPCPDASFDRVVASGSFYFMDVAKALSEIRRVLLPGGTLSMSLLPAGFTKAMLRGSFPRPVPTLVQFYAFANGAWFHCTGRTIRFINGRTEAFHTERGMRIALQRAGFVEPRFWWRPGVMSRILMVEAHKG